MKFTEFNFGNELQEGLDMMGFEKATPIQEQAIPIIQNNKDLIACAQTGTGKTAAFVLPILDILTKETQNNKVNTIIIAPTRELAKQIDMQIDTYQENVSKFFDSGNKAAGARARKALTDITKTSKELRRKIQDIKNQSS